MTISPTHRKSSMLISQLLEESLPPPPERRRLRRAVQARLRHVAANLGVSEAAVSYWERGICEPGPRHRLAYRQVLDDFAQLEKSNRSRRQACAPE